MPELRKDPIVGRWVIISTDRGKGQQISQSPRQRKIANSAHSATVTKTKHHMKSLHTVLTVHMQILQDGN